jgi:hypothetical protein
MMISRITDVNGRLVGLRFADIEIMRRPGDNFAIESGAAGRHGELVGADDLAELLAALEELSR